MIYPTMKRKVFISYFGDDEREVLDFTKWAHASEMLIPKIVHEEYSGIDSSNADYVMDRIRRAYLVDSTVTMVLVGHCTHSRRYVDWELKASLRAGDAYIPNGVLGVALPSVGSSSVWLPPRLEANLPKIGSGYARYYRSPRNAQELWDWIQDAYTARTERLDLIENSSDMMRYNARCQHCGVTHPAS